MGQFILVFLKWKHYNSASKNITPRPPLITPTPSLRHNTHTIMMNNHFYRRRNSMQAHSLFLTPAHTHARTHTSTLKEQIVWRMLSGSYMHSRGASHHSQRRQAGRARWGRYMLSEMGNKGVKARSGRPDITRGRRRR